MRKRKAAKKKAARTKTRRLSKAGHPIGGRPPKYSAECAKTAKKLAMLGLTEVEIASVLEISEATLWNWKSEHPLFLRSLRVGRAAADKRVEESLYRRAVGYTHPDTHIAVVKGKIVQTPLVKHYPPGEGAIKLWLTNRKPREWREIKSSVLSTPPGQPLEHKHTYGSTELLADYYARAAAAEESVLESAAAEGDPDLGEGDPPG